MLTSRPTAAHAMAAQSPLELVQDDLVSSLSDLYTGTSLLYSEKYFSQDDAMFVKEAMENLYNITEMLSDELDLDNPLKTELDAVKKSMQGQDSNTSTYNCQREVLLCCYNGCPLQSRQRASCVLDRLHRPSST